MKCGLVLVLLQLGLVLCYENDTDVFEDDIRIVKTGVGNYFSKDEIQYAILTGRTEAFTTRENDEYRTHVLDIEEPGSILFRGGPLPKSYVDKVNAKNIMMGITRSLKNQKLKCDVCPSASFMRQLRKAKYQVQGICNVTKFDCSSLSPWNLKYRTIDGKCNNLGNPDWGKSETVLSRIVEPAYADGISYPRLAVSGQKLPSARKLSAVLFPKDTLEDKKYTVATSIFSQVLSHDISLLITDYGEYGGIECCGKDGRYELPENARHHSCYPIQVPIDDPFFSKFKFRCMNFVRSIAIPSSNCALGPNEQMNSVTSYLDLSIVYGSTREDSMSLRTFRNGLLIEDNTRHRRFMPQAKSKLFCDLLSENEPCFQSGDGRTNQNLILVIYQTMFLRCHNNFAEGLKKINPRWSDEKIFQEARRLNIAVYQHITYKEWLPSILGKDFIDKLFEGSDAHGFTRNYDPKVNAAAINSYTLAFRVMHSTIPTFLKMYTEDRKFIRNLTLSDHYLRATVLTRNSTAYDDLIRGMVTQPMYVFDHRFTTQITQLLFKYKSQYGVDLGAIDIQRGRDHGIQSYNNFRAALGFQKCNNFKDLEASMTPELVALLESSYEHVDDIDFVPGVLYETPEGDDELGPLAKIILQEQFLRLMLGDRFFYTNKKQNYPFTRAQLREISKSTMSMIICQNSDDLQTIQPNAFELLSKNNTLTSCDLIPTINLEPWREIRLRYD